MDGINKSVFVILGNLQKKYFGAWKMSKGKGAASDEEKPREKSPEKTEESEDEEEVSFVCAYVNFTLCSQHGFHFNRIQSGRWPSSVPCSLLSEWDWSRYSPTQWWMPLPT